MHFPVGHISLFTKTVRQTRFHISRICHKFECSFVLRFSQRLIWWNLVAWPEALADVSGKPIRSAPHRVSTTVDSSAAAAAAAAALTDWLFLDNSLPTNYKLQTLQWRHFQHRRYHYPSSAHQHIDTITTAAVSALFGSVLPLPRSFVPSVRPPAPFVPLRVIVGFALFLFSSPSSALNPNKHTLSHPSIHQSTNQSMSSSLHHELPEH